MSDPTEPPAPPETRRRFGPRREEFAKFIELFALLSLLIAQPVFNFLGNNARDMTILRPSLGSVTELVLLVLFVPPAVVWLAEAAVGAFAPRARRLIHAVVTCVLLGVLAGNYLKVSTHLGGAPRVAASVVAGAVLLFFFLRTSALRQWLRFLAIAPLIFALLFITASPASILFFQDAKAADVKIAHPARVVMIVFDEFPTESLLDGTGHIDRELYPNFAKLADDSTWYRNETTVADYTVRAVPAILTGKLPPINWELPISSKYPQSLFTLLAKSYTMHADESYEQLCPLSMCSESTPKSPLGNLVDASSQVMHNLMDLNRASWDHSNGFHFGPDSALGAPIGVANRFTASLSPAKGPTVDYLHILLPHEPWQYERTGKDRGSVTPPIRFLAGFPHDQRRVGLGKELHVLNVQATDWWIGQVIDKLKAMGEYDNSLIVMTADHGVAFPYRRVTAPENYDAILWTPLFIKAPHQGVGRQPVGQLAAGRIDDRPMLSIDVLPTMADILGVKIPWKVDGVSALGPPRATGPLTIVHGTIGVAGQRETYDGPGGFAKVLASRAAPPGGDPALRVYRIGFYGALIGQSVAPLAITPAKPARGTLGTPGNWNNVDLNANYVPWAAATGTVFAVPYGTVAIAVNGRVAGLAVITNGGRYYAALAPSLFHAGKNDVTSYVVTGTAASPQLSAISTGARTP